MIKLRAPEPDDTDRLFLWENDSCMFESLPQPAPLSRLQIWQYIQNYQADPFVTHELRMMIVDSDITIGYVDIFDFQPADHRAGIAIYIDEPYRHKGYATQTLAQMDEYAAQRLGIHSLWAIVAIDNIPSRQLFTTSGYKPSGRLRSWIRRRGQYVDALIFQKLFP